MGDDPVDMLTLTKPIHRGQYASGAAALGRKVITSKYAETAGSSAWSASSVPITRPGWHGAGVSLWHSLVICGLGCLPLCFHKHGLSTPGLYCGSSPEDGSSPDPRAVDDSVGVKVESLGETSGNHPMGSQPVLQVYTVTPVGAT